MRTMDMPVVVVDVCPASQGGFIVTTGREHPETGEIYNEMSHWQPELPELSESERKPS